MTRFMSRLGLAGLLGGFLCAAAEADIFYLKNGEIIECKVVGTKMEKPPAGQQGAPKEVLVVKLEDGKERKINPKDIQYWAKRRPSWEVRKENKDWYAAEAPNVKDDWPSQEGFAKRCRQKKYLENESRKHFEKAWGLRKPEIPDTPEAHMNIARMLEKDWQLFDEAKEQWRLVYQSKAGQISVKDTPGAQATGHIALARWCMDEQLYDEAIGEYEAALALEPSNSSAKGGMEKLRKALEVPVYASMFKLVKEPLQKAVQFFRVQQNQDGSYGSDIKEAGVKGLHGMTALAGLALVALWEFDVLGDIEKAREPPKEFLKLLDFVLNNKDPGPALQGPDVWGPIFRLELLAKCSRKHALDRLKPQIKERAAETLQELQQRQATDGGWAYYTFVKTGIAFVTASAIVAMAEAKEAGLASNDDMIAKACAGLKICRKSPGIYFYRPGAAGEDEKGCAGRSPLCEYAMIRAGQGSAEDLARGVDNFFQNRDVLEAIKGKDIPHSGEGRTSGYYYLFDHYWTARAIKKLPRNMRIPLLMKLKQEMLDDQDPDQESNGCFWDWPITKDHKIYGTALGALCLYQLALDDVVRTLK